MYYEALGHLQWVVLLGFDANLHGCPYILGMTMAGTKKTGCLPGNGTGLQGVTNSEQLGRGHVLQGIWGMLVRFVTTLRG